MDRSFDVVDLRSDTVTRPTAAMREAIARAEVGDDVLGDDPTVRRLESAVAELLGKEAALFFPSGTMANTAALLAQATPGSEVIVEADSHIFNWEMGAAAQWGGLQLRPVPGAGGLLDAERVASALRPRNRYAIETALVCLENTHNGAGGRIHPLDGLRAVAERVRAHGLPLHLDGARLWHASAATGIPERDLAEPADTVMVTLSKGLGCPAGSLLAGRAELMESVWRIRRRLGGGMRQIGLLAAAGLHALEHHRDRLAEDHARAARLARALSDVPGLGVSEPDTNIVMIDLLHDDLDAAAVLGRLERRGVLLVPFGPRRLRAVTHLDVDDEGSDRAAEALAAVVAEEAA